MTATTTTRFRNYPLQFGDNQEKSLAGAEASHEPIERRCKCGEYYYVPANMTNRVKRCRRCQDEYNIERDHERWQEQKRRGENQDGHASNRSFGGAFKIVYDPCEGWSSHGSLGYSELRTEAMRGNLDDGSKWSDGTITYVVMKCKLVDDRELTHS